MFRFFFSFSLFSRSFFLSLFIWGVSIEGMWQMQLSLASCRTVLIMSLCELLTPRFECRLFLYLFFLTIFSSIYLFAVKHFHAFIPFLTLMILYNSGIFFRLNNAYLKLLTLHMAILIGQWSCIFSRNCTSNRPKSTYPASWLPSFAGLLFRKNCFAE